MATPCAPPPRPQRPQRQPIGDLQRVRSEVLEQRDDRLRAGHPVAARQRDRRRWGRHPHDAGVQAPARRRTPGDDQDHLVSGRAILRTEPVHRSTQTPGTRAVEIGDLNDPHTRHQSRLVCATDDTSPAWT